MQEPDILVSVLDLDNAIVGLDDHRTPTRARPITPIISLNDVNCATDRAMRPNRTRKNQKVLSDRVGLWWSLTDSNR